MAKPTSQLRALAGALVVGALALALEGCGGASAQGPAMEPAVVTVANPLVREQAEWSELPGRFVAAQSVEVRPRVSGYLQAVHFRDGDYVRQGQLLFTIDPLPFRARTDRTNAELAQADARLDRARSELRRAEALKAAEAISAEEYDTRKEALAQAVAARQAAQAALRTDALDLSYTRVLAPISGRISDRRVDAGNLVQSGQSVLTEIVSVDPIHFEFSAPESLLAGRGGTTLADQSPRRALIRLDSETEFSHAGRLDFLDNRIDPGTGTIRGRVVVDNAGATFRPGQFGRVRLLSPETAAVVLAPDAAIGSDQSRKFVLVVNAKNLVEYRQVEVGPKVGELRIVRAGLTGRDRIIINGLQRAMPGQPVKPTVGRIDAGVALNVAAKAQG